MQKVTFYDSDDYDFATMSPEEQAASFAKLESAFTAIRQDKIKTGPEFAAAHYEPLSWLDSDKSIPNPGRVIIYGVPNHGKTWVADKALLDIACSETQTRVMRIVGEGSMSKERDRLTELLYGTFHNTHYLSELSNLSIVNYPPDLFSAEGEWMLRRMIKEFQPKVIFLDPLVSVFTGDENSTKEARFFTQTLEALVTEFNLSVVLIHHTNKGNEEMRGSTTLRGWADAAYRVSKTIRDGVTYFKVTNDKMRDDTIRDDRHYKLSYFNHDLYEASMPALEQIDGMPKTDKANAPVKKADKWRAALIDWFVSENGASGGTTTFLFENVIPANHDWKTGQAVMQDLIDGGLIEKVGAMFKATNKLMLEQEG